MNENSNVVGELVKALEAGGTVKFKRVTPEATLPTRGTPFAAGLDLYAAEAVSLGPGAFSLVSTGFEVEIPEGHEGQVRPRSGLAAKKGLTVLNSPGTIDSDYRGQLKALLINHGPGTVDIGVGDRIAQLVVAPVSMFPAEEVEALSAAPTRGGAGFGSTGR